MGLSCTIFEIKRDIGRKLRLFHPPCIRLLHLEGPRYSVAIAFGIEKPEWCGYPTVEKV